MRTPLIEKRPRVSLGTTGNDKKRFRPNGTTPTKRFVFARVRDFLVPIFPRHTLTLIHVLFTRSIPPPAAQENEKENVSPDIVAKDDNTDNASRFPSTFWFNSHEWTKQKDNVAGDVAYYRCKYRRGKNPCSMKLLRNKASFEREYLLSSPHCL